MTKRVVLPFLVVLLVAGALLLAARPQWGPGPEVAVMRPQRREVVEVVIGSGRLRAARRVGLGAESLGTVEHVLVDEGNRVGAGQPLVVLRQVDAQQRVEQARWAVETARRELSRIRAGTLPEDVRRAEAELSRAEAGRRLAERELSRAQALFADAVIARADAERAETALEQARAQERVAREAWLALLRQPRTEDVHVAEAKLREAEVALRLAEVEAAKRVITAPFEGLVIQRQVERGQAVSPGQPLLTLVDMQRPELVVETDENNLPKLRPGQSAIAMAPAYPNQPFPAVLRQIGPEVDSQRGVVTLRLDPKSVPPYARPDITVDVNIEVARLPDALSVPMTTLVERGGRAYVLAVEDRRTRLQEVQVRGRGGDWAALEGLAPDTWLVLRATAVSPGRHVRTVESSP